MKKNRIKSNIGILMLVIIFSKLIGMSRDIVLANFFGTSSTSDAYIIAVSIPVLIFYLIGHAISTSYIPMYTKIRSDYGVIKADSYSNNITNISLIISIVIFVLLLFFPETVIKLFAAGFSQETISLSARFVRLSAFSIFFMIFINIFSAYLNVYRNFLVPASVSVPRNIVILFSIYLAYKYDIIFLGLGILLAYFAEFLFILIFVKMNGYKFKCKVNFKDDKVKETLFMVVPILISTGVSQINKIIDKSIASTIVEGGVSALNYASVINNGIQEVLVTGIITVMFANFAYLVAKGELDKVKEGLSKSINYMAFFLIPTTIGIIIFSKEIVIILFSRGVFDEASILMTSNSLIFYSIGLFFIAVRDIVIKVFYSFNNTRITTIVSIISIIINIVLNFVFSKVMGIKGLAFATSISAIFNSLVLYVLIRRKIGDFDSKETLFVIIKSLISSIVMCIILLVLKDTDFLNNYLFIKLFILVAGGVLIYFITSIILKNQVANTFLLNLRIRRKNSNNIS